MVSLPQGGDVVQPSSTEWTRRAAWALVVLGLSAARAGADPLYTKTDLGTLPGTTQSIATGINAPGQGHRCRRARQRDRWPQLDALDAHLADHRKACESWKSSVYSMIILSSCKINLYCFRSLKSFDDTCP